jgi:hypothetical protein
VRERVPYHVRLEPMLILALEGKARVCGVHVDDIVAQAAVEMLDRQGWKLAGARD